MKKKIIMPMLIITSLTIGIGLTSCKKECMNEFKKEMSKEFKKESPNLSDTLRNPPVNN